MLNILWTNPDIKTKDKVVHLFEMLKGHPYIIVLDNMEDLLDDQGQITDEDLRMFFEVSLVMPYSTCLLITTRIPLAQQSEIMPHDNHVPLLDGLPISEGIAKLRQLDPNDILGLRDATEVQLTEIVEHLHGVPRALEVFASILSNDPFATPDDIMKHFSEKVEVQRMIEGVYRRLDRRLQRVAEAVAIFGRPVPVVAVDYLLQPFLSGLDVPSIIQRLAHTHILSVDRHNKTITLHPIEQDYLYSQLPDEGVYNRRVLEHRAADYYAELCKPQTAWNTIADLLPQLSEFEHRMKAEEYDIAADLLGEIDVDYLLLWGHTNRVKLMRERLEGKIRNRSLQMNQANSLGLTYATLGRYQEAVTQYIKLINLAQEQLDKKWEVNALVHLGYSYRRLGQLEESVDKLRKGLNIAQEIGDQSSEASAFIHLGLAYRRLGYLGKAIDHYQRALNIYQKINNQRGEGVVFGVLGFAYAELERLDEAIDYYKQRLSISQNVNDRQGEAVTLDNLGVAYRRLGNLDDSLTHLQQSLSLYQEIGDRRGEGYGSYNLARAYWVKGTLKEALEYARRADIIFTEIDVPQLKIAQALAKAIEAAIAIDNHAKIKALFDCATAYADTGDLREALELAEEVKNIVTTQVS